MSDRLALANAIEDAGIERVKAERIATVMFDAIHQNVATKADLQSAETRLRAEIAGVPATLSQVEHRLLTQFAGIASAIAGVLYVALRLWPPHP